MAPDQVMVVRVILADIKYVGGGVDGCVRGKRTNNRAVQSNR